MPEALISSAAFSAGLTAQVFLIPCPCATPGETADLCLQSSHEIGLNARLTPYDSTCCLRTTPRFSGISRKKGYRDGAGTVQACSQTRWKACQRMRPSV